jgi:hypothetical protein
MVIELVFGIVLIMGSSVFYLRHNVINLKKNNYVYK